jgi:hypothetical protein
MVTPPRTPVTPIAASYSDGHYDEAQWYLGEALVYHQLERGGAGKSVPKLKHLIISNHPIQANCRTMSSQVMPFKKEYDQGIHFFVAVKELDKVLRIALGKVLDCQLRPWYG